MLELLSRLTNGTARFIEQRRRGKTRRVQVTHDREALSKARHPSQARRLRQEQADVEQVNYRKMEL